METILLTGNEGYMGWPTMLKLGLAFPDSLIIGVDNGLRGNLVRNLKLEPLVNPEPIKERIEAAKSVFGSKNLRSDFISLTDYVKVRMLLKKFKPDVIIHMASQPSAPYSQRGLFEAQFTQTNNVLSCLNLIWAIKEVGLDNTHLIVTTTTGIYGAPKFPIPEGNLEHMNDVIPYPAMAGSFYHMSRAFDAANLWLASRQFKFPITEIRTSIVCGSSTVETRKDLKLRTRFDSDFYFGTVLNRFVTKALNEEPIQVYGKGLQRKPMISLEDACRSIVEVVKKGKQEKLQILNQVEKAISIVDLAKNVSKFFEERTGKVVTIEHIPNPRIEDEIHQMEIDNKKFKALLKNNFNQTVEESIKQIVEDLT